MAKVLVVDDVPDNVKLLAYELAHPRTSQGVSCHVHEQIRDVKGTSLSRGTLPGSCESVTLTILYYAQNFNLHLTYTCMRTFP